MNKQEINKFIEQMEEIGDIWTSEQVEDVYGKTTLEEALKDRKSNIEGLFGIINKVLNK